MCTQGLFATMEAALLALSSAGSVSRDGDVSVDRYRTVKPLGRGAFAVALLANDTATGALRGGGVRATRQSGCVDANSHNG